MKRMQAYPQSRTCPVITSVLCGLPLDSTWISVVKKSAFESFALLRLDVIILVNNQLDSQFFFMYVYFCSLHVSGSHVPIIRRISCINTTSGICHSVQMTVWCAGLCESHPNLQINSHLQRVTYTGCHIDTINSPDDRHMAARNMQRIEINIHKKELCVKLVIYKNYTEIHGQQNIKRLDVTHIFTNIYGMPVTILYVILLWMHVAELCVRFNPLNPELNPICYLLALLGAHHFLHVSRIRVK